MPRSKSSQYGKNLERTRVAGQGLSRILEYLNVAVHPSGTDIRYNVDSNPPAYLQAEHSMPTTSLLVLLTAWTLLGPVSIAGSQPSILQQRDGTTSTLTPLGEGNAIHSDAHGNKGVTHLGSGLPSHTFSSPHGAVPGSVTPFGTPTPPNLVTPAPLLPLQPRGMATPYPQPPASSGSPGGYSRFGGQWGR